MKNREDDGCGYFVLHALEYGAVVETHEEAPGLVESVVGNGEMGALAYYNFSDLKLVEVVRRDHDAAEMAPEGFPGVELVEEAEHLSGAELQGVILDVHRGF